MDLLLSEVGSNLEGQYLHVPTYLRPPYFSYLYLSSSLYIISFFLVVHQYHNLSFLLNFLSICTFPIHVYHFFLSVFLRIFISISLSVCACRYLSLFLPVHIHIYHSLCVCIYMSIILSVCWYTYLWLFLSVHIQIYISFCLLIYISMTLSVCAFIYL